MIGLVLTGLKIIGPAILNKLFGADTLNSVKSVLESRLEQATEIAKIDLRRDIAKIDAELKALEVRAAYFALYPKFWARVQLAFLIPLLAYWIATVADSVILHYIYSGKDSWFVSALPEPMQTWAGMMIAFLFMYSALRGK